MTFTAQRKPMKRVGFKPKPRHEPAVQREPHPMLFAQGDMALLAPARPRLQPLRRGVYGPAVMTPAPKKETIQHEGYIRLVRQLPCAHCGRPGPSEFCHSDEGKGERIKSDCRNGWPGCKYRSPEEPGCHWLIGTKRIYPKVQRREIEARMAAQTRARIVAQGQWPKSLEQWKEADAA